MKEIVKVVNIIKPEDRDKEVQMSKEYWKSKTVDERLAAGYFLLMQYIELNSLPTWLQKVVTIIRPDENKY